MRIGVEAVGLAGRGTGGARQAKRRSRRTRTLLVLIAPSALLLALVNAYPVAYAAFQSVHSGSLIDSGPFVGASNFTTLFADPVFWKAASFTLIFTVVGVFGSWLMGLVLALLLQTNIPGRSVFKVLLLLPWIVPIVVSSTSWNWLVATPQSLVPLLLKALGGGEVLFLANSTLAALIVFAFKIWGSYPFMMMMSSSALAAVDRSLYEAARMDGATRWQQLRLVTMPMISRSTYVSWILMTIFCVNDFPTVYLLTGGGPIDATTSLVVLAFQTVFLNFQTGPGTAIAFTMTFTLVIISILLYRRIRMVDTE